MPSFFPPVAGNSIFLPWYLKAGDDVESIDSTITRPAMIEEFTTIANIITTSSSGSFAVTALTTQDGGGVRVTTGNTANSFLSARFSEPSSSTLIPSARNTHWAAFLRFKIFTLPSVATQYFQFILFDGSVGASLGAVRDTSTTMFSSGLSTSMTASTVPLDTNWHDALIINNGTNIFFYLDGVLINTIASSGLGTGNGFPYVFAFDGASGPGPINANINQFALFTSEP